MKKIIAMLLIAAPLLAFGQAKTISSLYKAYADKKGVTTVMLGPEMLKSQLQTTGVEITGSMMIITAEKSLSFTSKDLEKFKNEVLKIVSAPEYKVLMDVKDDDETVKMYACETQNKGELKNVVILVVESDEITMIGIDGTIPADAVSKLTKVADKHD